MNQQVTQTQNGRDVHKSINALHQAYREELDKQTSDCEELHIYDRYVRDLCDLLRNCIKYYERDERQMKAFYEERVSELTSELARYQQTTGGSEAADLVTSSQQNQPTRILEMMNNFNIDKVDKTNKTFSSDLRQEKSSIDLHTMCHCDKNMQWKFENEKLLADNKDLKVKLKSIQINYESLEAKCSSLLTEKDNLKKKYEELETEFKEMNAKMSIEADETSGDSTKANRLVKKEETTKLGNMNTKHRKYNMSDVTALVHEIADKHDHITSLRVKNRSLDERIEQLEQKVKFREKIIRELRRSTKCQPQSCYKHKHEHGEKNQPRIEIKGNGIAAVTIETSNKDQRRKHRHEKTKETSHQSSTKHPIEKTIKLIKGIENISDADENE